MRRVALAALCAFALHGCAFMAYTGVDPDDDSLSNPPPTSAGDATLIYRCAPGVESVVSMNAELRIRESDGRRAVASFERVFWSEIVSTERQVPTREYRRYWVMQDSDAPGEGRALPNDVIEIRRGEELLPLPSLMRSGNAEDIAVQDLLIRLIPNRAVAFGQCWIASLPAPQGGVWRVGPEVTLQRPYEDEAREGGASVALSAIWEADLPPLLDNTRPIRESAQAQIVFNVVTGRITSAYVIREWTTVPPDGSSLRADALLSFFHVDRQVGQSLSELIADGRYVLATAPQPARALADLLAPQPH
jgi:hypothetical protein